MKKNLIPKSLIEREPIESGESIEEMIRRCTESNEPIEASAPMIYTEEKDGVLAQHDIRADRFDLALDAIDKYNASLTAKSDNAPDNQQNSTGEDAPAGGDSE